MLKWLFIAMAALQGSGFAPFDAESVSVAPPTTITQLTGKTLRGVPSRLSWAPDGATLYVQTRDGVGAAAQTRHFQLRLGREGISTLDEEPDWAADYWHNKVLETAPGMPWLKIDVSLDNQRQRVAPFAGGFTGATGSGSDAASSYTLAYVTLRYLGVEIGRWMTDEPKSGVTFGWGPPGTGALAFVDKQGRLTLLDKEKRQRLIAKSSSVMLPAWSPDGSYVAFLEKHGRTTYQLMTVALVRTDTPLQ